MRNTGCGMLSAVALVKGLDTMFLTNALARTDRKPNAGPDYKALVCVFLFGGNDANNVVIPYTTYDDIYGPTRGPGVGLAIQRESLLQITPPSDPLGNTYGLHPALGAGATNRGIFGLWNENKAAIVVNTGTMIDPNTTKDQLRQGINRPYQLFSHSDQQAAWQSSKFTGASATGIGGRIADVFHGGTQVFPVVTSVAGVQVFTQGALTRPLIASAAPTQIGQLLVINRDFAPDNPIDQIVALDRGDGSASLVKASANIAQDSLDIRAALRLAGNPTIDTPFPNPPNGTPIGNQLLQVAKLIKTSRDFLTNVTRQVFFVSIGGFDTHNNQGTETGQQSNLWSQVSQAMTAFYDATIELGLQNQVTAFTMSDFSRTLKPANPGAGVGSDHAWASHHFVIGGAVNGGDFYGTFPDLTIGGPQDYDLGTGSRGRYIPTQGVDQVAYTLAKWYGVPIDQLPIVVPNIVHFQGSEDLGFMQAGNAPGAAERAARSARAG